MDALLQLGRLGLSGQADADEALAGGEDDAAVLVIPGVGFVLAHHRELHAVDGEQLFQGEAQGLGDEDVDLHQRLAASVVAAQGVMALPLGGEVGEEVPRQGAVGNVIGGSPLLLTESLLPVGLPKVCVMTSHAAKCQLTAPHRIFKTFKIDK